MKKSICSLSCLLFIGAFAHAQDIEVKKFEPMVKDQTAALSPRKDINGTACGLVKVQFELENLQFEGNVIGDVLTNSSVYLVYLSKGTKKVTIKHPDFLPLTIVFGDYGISRIESNVTYNLVLKGSKKKVQTFSNKKKYVVFNVIPSLADLYVDNQLISKDDNGTYALPLSYGIHVYSVKYNDFGLYNQMLMINSKTTSVDLDLTDYYADLEITCSSKDVDIYINNKYHGKDEWRGKVLPGRYVIEARRKGYTSVARTFELQENDSINMILDALSPVTGSLRVDYKPYDSEVIIDGKSAGVTPLYVSNIPVGEHRVSVKRDGFDTALKFIKIEEGQELTLEGFLELNIKTY